MKKNKSVKNFYISNKIGTAIAYIRVKRNIVYKHKSMYTPESSKSGYGDTE